jgi:hypothetical protein
MQRNTFSPQLTAFGLGHQTLRTLFAPRVGDSEQMKLFRSAWMGLAFSTAELPYSVAGLNLKAAMHTDPYKIKNIFMAGRLILDARGFRGFFTSASVEFLRQALRQGVRGPCVTKLPELYKTFFSAEFQKQFWFAVPVASGTTTAVIEVVGTNPAEALRVYLSTRGLAQTEAVEFKPLKGMREFAARQIPAWNLFFLTSTWGQAQIRKYRADGRVTYLSLFCISPFVSASFIVPPNIFDLLKHHQQLRFKSPIGLDNKSIWQGLNILFKEFGLRAPFIGASASVLQRIPTAWFLMASQKFFADQNALCKQVDAPGVMSFTDLGRQAVGLYRGWMRKAEPKMLVEGERKEESVKPKPGA